MEVWYIEDDADIASLLPEALSPFGFTTRIILNGTEARNQLRTFPPSVLLVDWMLPDADGRSLCAWARRLYPGLPIIMVTVRDDPEDIIKGLRAGADDYVTKPFNISVLAARIQALMRRASPGGSLLTCGKLRLETDSMRAFLCGEPLELTPTEHQLLHLFMRNKGRIVTRDVIREELWGIDGVLMNDNSLSVAIKRLRSKLADAPYLKTIRTFGYRLDEPL